MIASPLFAGGVVYAATEAGSSLRFARTTERSSGRIGSAASRRNRAGRGGSAPPARSTSRAASSTSRTPRRPPRARPRAGRRRVDAAGRRPPGHRIRLGRAQARERLAVRSGRLVLRRPGRGKGRRPRERCVAVDVAAQAPAASFDTVPGRTTSAACGVGAGVSVEPDASAVWTAVGNSVVFDEACRCTIDDAGYGDSVVKLTPLLDPIASNRPAEVPSTNDYDFGAAPLLFDVPGCGAYAAANNKNGYLYIWSRDDLAAGPIAEFPWHDERAVPGRAVLVRAGEDAVRRVDERPPPRREPRRRRGRDQLHGFLPSVLRWQAGTGTGTQPPPLVLGEALFAAGGSGGWSVLSAATGDVLWHRSTPVQTLAPPIAAADGSSPPTRAGRSMPSGSSTDARKGFTRALTNGEVHWLGWWHPSTARAPCLCHRRLRPRSGARRRVRSCAGKRVTRRALRHPGQRVARVRPRHARIPAEHARPARRKARPLHDLLERRRHRPARAAEVVRRRGVSMGSG